MVRKPWLLALLGLGLSGRVLAQRPADASTCDYYAQVKFGANNSDTQFRLVQGILSLAFGGTFNLSEGSSEITGILNPGTFSGESIDLRPWFDGTKASSNLNNEAVGINWLDGGELDPLYRFLSGETTSLEIAKTTNQYRLFSDFSVAYAHIFGCSNPPASDSPAGHLSLAYVHKFMNLTFNDVGHFIDMLTRSAIHYGFSDIDAQTFNSSMNARYNVRCAPPITLSAAQGPQLFSLCQNPTCPLAEPNPDCAAYVNLTADGSVGSSNTGVVTTSVTVVPTSSATSVSPTSAAGTGGGGGSSLSGGAIAGITIGSLAVVGIFVLAGILLWRRKRTGPPPPPTTIGSSTLNHSVYGSGSAGDRGSHTAEVSSQGGHPSYLWNNPPTAMVSEVEGNPRHSVFSGDSHQSWGGGSGGHPSPRMSPSWSPDPGFTSFPKVPEEGSNAAELSAT